MSKILDVYLQGIFVGQLIQNSIGKMSFIYDEKYLEKNYLAISISLPLTEKPYEGDLVKAFFSGFLPDDDARYKLAKYLGVSDKNSFALLEIIGGECAGALSLYPQGVIPQESAKEELEVLDQSKLSKILELLKKRPLLAGYDGLRLSLAGAQSKIAVTLKDNQIALVLGNNPTTHILKPAIEDIDSSAYNELFCMRLAKMMGVDVPHSEIRTVNSYPYFLVERYDRIQDNNGNIIRLHQEDFCQALGLMPEIKYEREGGPNFLQCNDLLYCFSSKPAVDQRKFLERVIFNYLIGNADAHGKNFSLLYKDKKPALAPAYDLLSTAVYTNLSSKMAMKIGGKYNPEDVVLRHWHRLVPDTELARKEIEKQLQQISKSCLEKAYILKKSLEKEGVSSSIFEDICFVIQKRADRIKN
jgi:serine/threonine-protein kinase HipA